MKNTVVCCFYFWSITWSCVKCVRYYVWLWWVCVHFFIIEFQKFKDNIRQLLSDGWSYNANSMCTVKKVCLFTIYAYVIEDYNILHVESCKEVSCCKEFPKLITHARCHFLSDIFFINEIWDEKKIPQTHQNYFCIYYFTCLPIVFQFKSRSTIMVKSKSLGLTSFVLSLSYKII